MSEMAQTADHLIVLGRGKLLADAPIAEILAAGTRKAVRVRTPQLGALVAALATTPTATPEPDLAEFSGRSAAEIGALAAANGIVLHELTPVSSSLEEAYLELTQDSVEYHSEAAR